MDSDRDLKHLDSIPLFGLPTKQTVKNSFLATLSLLDFASIRPLLKPISLVRGSVLNEPNRAIEHVTFVESGIVSLMALTGGNMLETAIVGRHGAVGASVALGARTSIHRSTVLVSGSALGIRVEDLQRSMENRPHIREHLLRYVHSLMIHSSQTALCGVHHALERRLACWICLACDALEHQTVAITHDHLSFILGLRRSGVTEALMRFEELGFVRKARGVLQVRERQSLQQRACGCYCVIAAAYGWTTSGIANSSEA